MDSLEPSQTDVASAEDVVQAIRALSPADYVRLKKAAAICMGGTAFKTPDELVQAAVSSAYFAAQGEGGRKWRKAVPYIAYLFKTIQGLASDSRDSAAQRKAVTAQTIGIEEGSDRDVFDAMGATTRSVETELVETEEQLQRELREDDALAAVESLFKGDDHVEWIMEGIRSHTPASQVCELSKMSQAEYEAAHRRWRRGLEKLFPGRRKK